MLALPVSSPLKRMRIFMRDPAFDAVVRFLRSSGLPAMLTMDRDVRSRWERDESMIFRSRLLQFLSCVGVQPDVLPLIILSLIVTWSDRTKHIKPSVSIFFALQRWKR
jgi:hypothetical protein